MSASIFSRSAVFLDPAAGEPTKIPTHDNGSVLQAALFKYPLRLVAYDSSDRVIGVATLKGEWQDQIH